MKWVDDMIYFAFAIFFAFNFSLWYILPALLLKAITPDGKKKKDKKIKNDYIVYAALAGIYVFAYLMYFKYFKLGIEGVEFITSTGYIVNEINNLSVVLIFFLVISLLLTIYTFYLSTKLFKMEQYNKGYVFISLTGFLNVVTYFFSNSVLSLNLYAFEAERYLLNFVMRFDNEFLLFVFPILVFAKFASSFIEEK